MNIYLVLEDLYGVEIYSKWIKYINPRFYIINNLDELKYNCIYIVSGRGFPFYYEIIENAIKDLLNNQNIDRLVVAVDSEELTYDEKFNEMKDFIDEKSGGRIDYKIIIQHFCLETWALGNRNIVSRNPNSVKLREYLNYFNISIKDPELLPHYDKEELNRAQFAEKYLRTLLNEKYRKLTYQKRNPTALLNRKYFEKVKSRYVDTGHIKSFNDFLHAFV